MVKDKNITKDKLIALILALDKAINEKIVLVAIGGTALQLLDLKTLTDDVDFMIESDDNLQRIDIIVGIDKLGYQTEVQERGMIVILELPPDYVKLCSYAEINSQLKNLTVLILSPLDIIITKISRYAPKDMPDLTNTLLRYKLPLEIIEERFKQYLRRYGGNKREFASKFEDFKELYSEVMKN